MKPAATDYLEIEAALQSRLLQAWRRQASPLYKRMVEALSAGAYDEALAIARSIDLSPIAVQNREFIKSTLWRAAEFGAKQAAQSHSTAVAVGSYIAMLNTVADLFIRSFSMNVTKRVQEGALQSIANIENELKAVKKADAHTRFVRDFVSFKDQGDDMVKMVSSLHSSRLAVWGFTAEAEVRGISTYKLSAVLDDRTSMFCRFIDGKEFSVSDARSRILSILKVQDPEDLRTLAPWPNQTKAALASYRGMTNNELAALGYSVPPFHPNCRTICQLVSVVTASQTSAPTVVQPRNPHAKNPDALLQEGEEEDEENEFLDNLVQGGNESGQGEHQPIATQESFDELGIAASSEELLHWQKMFKVAPADVLDTITGTNYVEDGKNVSKAVSFAANGDVTLRVKDSVAGGKLSASMVFDPYRQQVFLSHVEFDDAPPLDADTYLKTLLNGSFKVAEAAGMTSVVVGASGDLGVYTHAKMGFVLTSNDWALLKTEIETELPSLGLTDQQLKVVTAILRSNDPKAVWTLAELNTTVHGEPLGRVLLEGKKYSMELHFHDYEATQRAGLYL